MTVIEITMTISCIKVKKKESSSILPFLDFVLRYSKPLMVAIEQRLNLCVCPV